MRHLPNAITIVRILLTPAVLFLLFTPGQGARIWALVLFVIASLSDYLDGKLARMLGVGTELGKFLDPVADKVLVLGTFAGLAVLMPDDIAWLGVALLAARAAAVTLLRMHVKRTGRSLQTSQAGKIKTAFQLTFLILVLVLRAAVTFPDLAAPVAFVMESGAIAVLFWVVVLATVWTGVVYFRTPAYD